MSQWGLEDIEFDMDGEIMPGMKQKNTETPNAGDGDVYQ
jgi:hypothetical protein